jgi:predicted nucleotidyltransferase
MTLDLKVISIYWLNLRRVTHPVSIFFLIEAELSKLLGRKVDLQTRNFLSADILKNALSEAVGVYEQA